VKRIGLLSDTHNNLPKKVFDFFKDCDEIWHAGDIGSIKITDKLSRFKPVKAVYGNMDGHDVRIVHPKIQLFFCEDVKVLMTHIGGYPGRYETDIRKIIEKEKPKLFISGHSHILKVINDHKYSLLHMNPGAAGRQGIHQLSTLLRFVIDSNRIKDLEVLELNK